VRSNRYAASGDSDEGVAGGDSPGESGPTGEGFPDAPAGSTVGTGTPQNTVSPGAGHSVAGSGTPTTSDGNAQGILGGPAASGSRFANAGGTGNSSDGSGGPGSAGGGNSGNAGSDAPAGNAPDNSLTPDGYESPQGASVVVGSQGPGDTSPPAAFDSHSGKNRMNPAASRGKDWALRDKPGRSVPIRRSIRVDVRSDQLAIASDSARSAAGGKPIPLRGDTVESLDEFVKQVQEQIAGWGIAGNGLYWRPVIVLNVAPDGQRRAEDLARLLKNSGLELRTDDTARNRPQGAQHETR